MYGNDKLSQVSRSSKMIRNSCLTSIQISNVKQLPHYTFTIWYEMLIYTEIIVCEIISS